MECIEDKLNGKLIFVAGASNGIGKSLAQALGKYNCRIVLCARTESALVDICKEINIKRNTDLASYYVCDMANMDAFRGVLENFYHEYGVPDVVVSVAGVGGMMPFEDIPFEDLLTPLQIPLQSSMLLSWFFAPLMKDNTSQIIYLTSPSSFIPFPYMIPYSTARYGLKGMVDSLNDEYRQHKLTFTLMCLGAVKTDYVKRNKGSINWFPKIADFVNDITPDRAARKIIDVMLKQRKLEVYPKMLYAMVSFVRHFPSLFLKIYYSLKLNKPSNK